MAKYRIEGVIVDTDNATAIYEESVSWDGSNHISDATGSQWIHETMYRSRRGRYYVVRTSQYQGSRDRAEFVSPEEAARWLSLMGHEIPDELKSAAEAVTE